VLFAVDGCLGDVAELQAQYLLVIGSTDWHNAKLKAKQDAPTNGAAIDYRLEVVRRQ
jgi:hypothetical protein